MKRRLILTLTLLIIASPAAMADRIATTKDQSGDQTEQASRADRTTSHSQAMGIRFPTVSTNHIFHQDPGAGGGDDFKTCTKNYICNDQGNQKGKCESETQSGGGCKKSGTTCFDCAP